MSSFVAECIASGGAKRCNHVDITGVQRLDPNIASLGTSLARSVLFNAHAVLSQYSVEASISKCVDRSDWELCVAHDETDVHIDAILQPK